MRPQKFRDWGGPWDIRHLGFYTNHLKLVNSIPDDWDAIKEEDIQVVEGFVCAMHGKKRILIRRSITSRTALEEV